MLCDCLSGPRCQYHHCRQFAYGRASVPVSWKPFQLGEKWFCLSCWNYFCKAWNTPMKGIDRPADADDEWRPSIMDHLRHAQIAIAFAERDQKQKIIANTNVAHIWPDWETRFTAPQLRSVKRLLELQRTLQ